MDIYKESFGKNPDGEKTTLWTIRNSKNVTISLTDWGAAIVSVRQPDINGITDNILLGFEGASHYTSAAGYLGATCGRYAGGIALGKFNLGGQTFQLACNNGKNHIHGGTRGFNSKLWKTEPYNNGDKCGVVFSLFSPDGDENYPGDLNITADYALDEKNRLSMSFTGKTNKTTILNITNHAYWNLAGTNSGTVMNHLIKFHASRYLPEDTTGIPTGEIRSVEGTPFNLRKEIPISREYDQCMVIDGNHGEMKIAAEVRDPASGRKLTLYTDRPGVQFYTGNYLSGNPFPKNGGLCLEPQDFPDAPNHPGFPSVILHPGDTYRHRSFFEFSHQT